MTRTVAIANAVLNRLFDALLAPLLPLQPLAALTIISALTAVVILLVVRATSNQAALAAVKRQIHADLFEMRLFRDDFGAMVRAQGEILRHNGTYLRLSLVPMLWSAIPVALAIAQLDGYFGYLGAPVDRPVIVTAQLSNAKASAVPELEVPAGLRADTPAVWFPALQQVAWRVVPQRAGGYTVRLRFGEDVYPKTLDATEGLARRSEVRPSEALLDQVLHPSELPLRAQDPVASIRVDYAERRIRVFGWEMPWIAVYFIETIIFALVFRVPLRVTI